MILTEFPITQEKTPDSLLSKLELNPKSFLLSKVYLWFK